MHFNLVLWFLTRGPDKASSGAYCDNKYVICSIYIFYRQQCTRSKAVPFTRLRYIESSSSLPRRIDRATSSSSPGRRGRGGGGVGGGGGASGPAGPRPRIIAAGGAARTGAASCGASAPAGRGARAAGRRRARGAPGATRGGAGARRRRARGPCRPPRRRPRSAAASPLRQRRRSGGRAGGAGRGRALPPDGMLLKSELDVMWWMMSDWCADTRRGVGDEHCSADSGGGDVRAPPPRAPHAPPSDHSCRHVQFKVQKQETFCHYKSV